MKKRKSFIAILLALVIVVSFAACTARNTDNNPSGVTVTDENGEVVTDENGTPVTVIFDEKAHADLADKESAKGSEGKDTTAGKNNSEKSDSTAKSSTKQETLSKVKNPNTVKKINISNVTESGMTLSWEAVYCDYYELEYKRSGAERWETVDDNLKATSIDLTGLESMTQYSFRLRAIIKHKAGNSESNWTEAKAKTKEQDLTRKIKIYVTLPTQNSDPDVLELFITDEKGKREKVTETDVKYDGSTVSFETKDKYKGVVTVEAHLKKADALQKVKTDKDYCEIDITGIGIDVIIGEDD